MDLREELNKAFKLVTIVVAGCLVVIMFTLAASAIKEHKRVDTLIDLLSLKIAMLEDQQLKLRTELALE